MEACWRKRKCVALWWEKDTDVCTGSGGIGHGRDGNKAGAGAGNASGGVGRDVGGGRDGLEVFAVGPDAVVGCIGGGGACVECNN